MLGSWDSPSLVSGVWVGGEDRDIHFNNMVDGQGANLSLPVWAIYMNKVYKDPELGYSQDEKFDVSEQYLDPCATVESEFDGDEPMEYYED